MADIRPFACIRPTREAAPYVAALPYDVYDEAEARRIVSANPQSFLAIDRPETAFPEGTDPYADCVYRKAADLLWDWVRQGILQKDEREGYYLYEQTYRGRTQTGFVACASVDEYLFGVIKKHENTRAEKEADRTRHIDVTGAQTGPIFLAYRANFALSVIAQEQKNQEPLYDFVSDDGVRQRVYGIFDPAVIAAVREIFSSIDRIYIADGHHRAASAVTVSLMRRAAHPDYDGTEPFNFFLSVLFPDDELQILDYNRLILDLGGRSEEEFLTLMRQLFVVQPYESVPSLTQKGTFGLYLGRRWYLCLIPDSYRGSDPAASLDVSILQDRLFGPYLGITDPKTDPRIDFVGGKAGLLELQRRCETDASAAFAMAPTTMEELFAVADAGELMPPKSTWFEPKLLSGLFIHEIS